MPVHAVPPDDLPEWENLKTLCLEDLGLHRSAYFIDKVHRVTVSPSGSITGHLEVHSFDGTPAHFAQSDLAPLPTVED
jgi:hypothetical protein